MDLTITFLIKIVLIWVIAINLIIAPNQLIGFALRAPEIRILQKPSLGSESKVIPDATGNITFGANVVELRFTCWSEYPTRWMMVPSPHRAGSSIKEWQVDKGRRANLTFGHVLFWSEVVVRLQNNPNRDMRQSAACHHFEDQSTNANVIISSMRGGVLNGNLLFNTNLTRSKTMSERFGRNKNCSLVMHFDLRRRELACANRLGFYTHAPYFLECHNPDECGSSVQREDTSCAWYENYNSLDFEYNCTDIDSCTQFKMSGALWCEYDGGGRNNSVAQVVYYDFNKTPYFPPNGILPPLSSRLKIEVAGNKSFRGEYYNGTKVTFTCSGVLWYFSQGFQWGVEIDGKPQTYRGTGNETTEGRTAYSSTIEIEIPSVAGLTKVCCIGPVLNSELWENVTLEAVIRQSEAPSVNLSSEMLSNGAELTCYATGKPLPTILWKKDDINLSPSLWHTTRKEGSVHSVLHVPRTAGEQENYTCQATNPLDGKTAFNTIRIKHQPATSNMGVTVGIPISIILILLLIGLFIYWKIRQKYRDLQKLTEDEINEFNFGDLQSASENTPHFYPYNTDYEISKTKIHFESKVLGDGQFGRVTRGRLDKTYVAIKTVKKFADISYLKALLSELKISCYVGKHEHIVNLIGGCTQNIHKREVYLIYEYCANGNILKYLRKYKSQFVQSFSNRYRANRESISSVTDYQNVSIKKISSRDLLRWAAEIAAGMEFLSDKNIVHGDLAARNILLTESLKAKVGDFGLSKELRDYSVYVQKMECPLPLKWMAIESLRDLEFSVKSDVWAYGVTLWEIYSLGQAPYPGKLQWDWSSWKILQEGYRMTKPPYASDEVFNCMLRCWMDDPASRPTFSMLKNVFEGFLVLVTGAPSLRIHS